MSYKNTILKLMLLFSLMSTALAGSEDWRIVLCMSENPSNQLNVSWRMDTLLSKPSVQIALNLPEVKFFQDAREIPAQSEAIRLTDGSQVFAYSAKMMGLDPGTTYAYRVGSEKTWSEWFVFTTAEESEVPFRFLFFGDPQNGLASHVPRVFRAAYAAAPDAAFMTMAGDLVSVPGIDEQWEDFFHAGAWLFSQIPQAPLMGNHAYYVGGKWTKHYSDQWRPHFTLPENGLASLPETNYYFHYQGLLFVVLNGSEQLKEQARWLDDLLNQEASTWIVLSMHQPIYSTGEGRKGEKRRDIFLPVIDKHQVDLVLQGHDHTFGRTYPLKAGKRVKRKHKGTVYINSVSGSKQYKLKPLMADMFAVTGDNKQYYHIVEVEASEMRLLSYTVDGTLADEIRIEPAKRR